MLTASVNTNRADPAVIARRKELAMKGAKTTEYIARSRAIAKRQSIGGDLPVAANDNEHWPLVQQLRRDGNDILVGVAERYRAIYNAAKFEPRLVGTMPDDFWSVEQRHMISKKTGKLKLNGQKRSKTAASMPVDDGTYKADAVTDERWGEITANGPVTFQRRPASPTLRKWNGDDALIASIDAKPMLIRLQDKLGPLLDVFEDAIIGDATFTDIGAKHGANTVARGPVGKVLVMMGLAVIQEEFGKIDSEARVNTPNVEGRVKGLQF